MKAVITRIPMNSWVHLTGLPACLYVYICTQSKVIKPDGFTSASLSAQVKPTPLRPRAELRAPPAERGSEAKFSGRGPSEATRPPGECSLCRAHCPRAAAAPAGRTDSRRPSPREQPGPARGSRAAASGSGNAPSLPGRRLSRAGGAGQRLRSHSRVVHGSSPTAPERRSARRPTCAAGTETHESHLGSGGRTEPPRTPRPRHLRTCPAALSPPPAGAAAAPAATPRLRPAARPAPRLGRAPPPPRPPAPPAARHGTASPRPRRDSPDGAGLPAPRGLPAWSRTAFAAAGAESEGAAERRAPRLGPRRSDRSGHHVPLAPSPRCAGRGVRDCRRLIPSSSPRCAVPQLPGPRTVRAGGKEHPAAAARSRAERLLLGSVQTDVAHLVQLESVMSFTRALQKCHRISKVGKDL